MRNRMVKGKALCVLAVALAALLLVTACAAPTIPTTGKNVVEIGVIGILTGGGGTADQPCFRSIEDYIRYYNEERGIPGVTLKMVWRDCGTQIAPFISAYRVFADSGVPIIFSNYPTPLEGLKPQLEKDRIPFVTAGATGPLIVPAGWIFAAWPTQGEAATVLLNYFMESWTEERPPKLQLFVLDETYGRSPAAEVTPWAQSIGYEVLPLEVCPHQVIDTTVQLLRIREREADLVYIQHMNPTAAAGPIMRDAERLGLYDKMQFSGCEWTMGEGLIAMSPPAVEGYLSPRALPWFDETEIPGVKALIDTKMKYHGEIRHDPTVMVGWACGAILCEAARRAVEEVGADNVDGPAMKRALESMQDFDIDGMVKITFGPEDRRGETRCAIYQVQGGKIVRVSDPREVNILVP